MPLDRRTLIAGSAALLAPRVALAQSARAELRALEDKAGGRIGVFGRNVRTGATLDYRGSERFTMCSTFKVLAVANLLARVDAGHEQLDRMVRYGRADLLPNSPVTKLHVRRGRLSLQALCEAAMEVSDNTAANLILKQIGGPPGLTKWLRSIGDHATRLDRTEPGLNTPSPKNLDTTTPGAMADTLQALLLGKVLSPASQGRLTGWMIDCKTGLGRLRAGAPQGWRIGDKTGTGAPGLAGDNAILWPDPKTPILISAYMAGGALSGKALDGVFADIGRIATGRLVGRG